MSVFIAQPHLILRSIGGIVGLWTSGVQAAHAHLTYGTYAADALGDISYFFTVAEDQLAFLNHVHRENISLARFAPDAEIALKTLRHDLLNSLQGVLAGQLEIYGRNKNRGPRIHQLARQEFNIRPTLQQLTKRITSLAHAEYPNPTVDSEIQLSGDIRFTNPHIAQQAHIVLFNLITNAIKYNKEEGGAYRVHNDGCTIIVEDSGVGMDPEFAERLGNGELLREERVNVKGDGIGWGRSIARICEEMGWEWKINSTVGKGTEVTIIMKDDDFTFTTIDRSEPLILNTGFIPLAIDEVVKGAEWYMGLDPFTGYSIDGKVDVSASPIFEAIQRANWLMAHLAVHLPA